MYMYTHIYIQRERERERESESERDRPCVSPILHRARRRAHMSKCVHICMRYVRTTYT